MRIRTKESSKQLPKYPIANRISKGAVIEGEIKSETDIRVDGRINGVLHCDAKLVIGHTGELEGDVYCKDAACEGKITGKLEVNGLLHLKKEAVIDGDVYYKRLIVEEGACIHGNLIMSGGTTKSLVQDNGNSKSNLVETSQTA